MKYRQAKDDGEGVEVGGRCRSSVGKESWGFEELGDRTHGCKRERMMGFLWEWIGGMVDEKGVGDRSLKRSEFRKGGLEYRR